MKQKIFFAALLALLVGTFTLGTLAVNAKRDDNGDKIPGQYIVMLKSSEKDVDADIADIELKHKGEHLASYHSVFNGFAVIMSADEADKVKKDPRVAVVVQDQVVNALGKSESTRFKALATQALPAGVKRIGANVSASKGAGVTVAVIDTGINLSHPDLKANILNNGVNCINKFKSTDDDNGHGSHVAGTIAAVNNGTGVVGVAPQAKLIPVKVLDHNGSGTWSSVICGIDWVTAHASQYNIKVANMSLGGAGVSDNNCGNTNNDPLHKAICKSRDAGVTYVVAAGNDGASALQMVPAAYDDAVITVSALADSNGSSGGGGATTSYGADDTFATFSNYGSIVDLGAPGVNIYSTWKSGGYAVASGTSMASPHVAGSAAVYIAGHVGATWTQVRDGLVSLGEVLGLGHTDPSLNHPEPVVNVSSL